MKTVQFKFKSESFSIVNIEIPEPANDEVLIKVQYSALDTAHQPAVDKEIIGHFTHKLQDPLYLGYHYAGTIEKAGSGSEMKPGTDVFGFLQYDPSQTQGAFSEYIVVKASECAEKPKGVSFEEAAAASTESITALQAIRDLGGLKKGQEILIVGAAGGVGSAAVQIAKSLGAHVTAVCSSKDVVQVKEWGADIQINRSLQPGYLNEAIRNNVTYDVIFDTADALPSSALKLLKSGGSMVHTSPSLTFLWNKIVTVFGSKKVSWVMCYSQDADLDYIAGLLDNRSLEIPIDSTFEVKDMDKAMEKQKGAKKGRVTIKVADGWE